MKRILKMSKF